MTKERVITTLSKEEVFEIEKRKIAGLLQVDKNQLNNYEKSEILMDFYRQKWKRSFPKFG